MPRDNHSGFTLIELMITIAVLAILAAIALPSFTSVLEGRRLVGAADSLFSDLQFARSEAIKQNKPVIFHFDVDAWCYGIDDELATDCDCEAAPSDCTINGQSKIDSEVSYKNVVMQSNSFVGDTIVFSPINGIPDDNGRFQLTIGGRTKTVSINPIGRVSVN